MLYICLCIILNEEKKEEEKKEGWMTIPLVDSQNLL